MYLKLAGKLRDAIDSVHCQMFHEALLQPQLLNCCKHLQNGRARHKKEFAFRLVIAAPPSITSPTSVNTATVSPHVMLLQLVQTSICSFHRCHKY